MLQTEGKGVEQLFFPYSAQHKGLKGDHLVQSLKAYTKQ